MCVSVCHTSIHPLTLQQDRPTEQNQGSETMRKQYIYEQSILFDSAIEQIQST